MRSVLLSARTWRSFGPTFDPPAPLRYAVAIASILAALALRFLLAPILSIQLPLLTFFPAIVITAWFGGLGPGLLATALSCVTMIWFFFEPLGSFSIADSSSPAGLVLFAGFSGLLCVLTERVRQANHKVRTARRQAEARNAYQANLLANVYDAILATDEQLVLTAWNARAEEMYGWKADEVIGRKAHDVIRSDMTHAQRAEGQKALAETGHHSFECVHYHRAGRPFWIQGNATALQDETGRITGYVAVHRDISERKEAEQALERSNRQINNILESITDEFFAVDREWRFTYINERALRSIQTVKGDEELTREDVLGNDQWEVVPQVVGSVFHQKYHEAMREQKTVNFEAYSPFSNRWGEVHAYGSDEGLSVYAHDITQRKRAEEQLRYHAYLLENVHDAVIATDERLTVTAWNKGAERMYGWRADEALGRHMWEVVPVALSDEQRADALKELQQRDQYRTEAVTYRRDGTPVSVEGITIALRGEQGQEGHITGYVNIRRDITERKRAEEALRESHRRIERILESITDEFTAVDREWRYTYVNERVLRRIRTFIGEEVTREEVQGKNIWELYPGLVGTTFYEQAQRALREQKTVHFEAYSPLSASWLEMHAYPSDEGLSIYAQDITARKRAEESRNELVRRLFAAQEDERRRLSRDLHDEFGQQLSVLKLTLAVLKREHGEHANLGEQLASLEAIAEQLDSDVDLLAWQLRPAALDDIGLGAALSDYVNRWSERFDMQADLHISGMESSRLTTEIETALYRVMQEALNNIAKHARAQKVGVVLQCHTDHVSLIVEDDGVGFDVKQAFDTHQNQLGLIGMRERATLLGGTLDVESGAAHGTTVVARLPTSARPESTNPR